MRQLKIDFNPDVVVRFPEFKDVVRESVYGCGKSFKVVAAELDMSSSELSRKLNDNPTDNVNFPLHKLPDLLQATGDLRPLYWLIESFLEDPHAKKQRMVEEASGLVKRLTQLLSQVDVEAGVGK